jgi:hypothetical protein
VIGRAVIAGIRQPDLGPGMWNVACDVCEATWVGRPGDACSWCQRAEERQREDQRRLLLDPPWLHSDCGNVRYDELSAVDRAVWDRTRGQTRGADSIKAWHGRLVRGVESRLISEHEARTAWHRRGSR